MTAREFALVAHADQSYGDHPYVYHLDAVADVLREFGFGSVDYLIDAAYLHDTMEDCGVTVEQIYDAGFNRSRGLVSAVTNEPGRNRAQRHAATYPKIAGWEDATILKLADRIANVRECIRNKDSKRSMYAKEYAGFYRALWRERHSLAAPMWAELDRLHAGPENPTVMPS